MPRDEGRTIVRPSFFLQDARFSEWTASLGAPAQSRLLVGFRRRGFLASRLFWRRRSLFGRLFWFLVDRFDLDDRLAFVRDRGHTIRKIEISHPDGITGVNEFRDVDVDLVRNTCRQCLHLDLGADLGEHAVDRIAWIVEGNRHDRANWHAQVRGEEVDMNRLAAHRILLHLANEHRLVTVLPAEHEERRMPVGLIELEKVPAVDTHRDRASDDWAVDDAGHKSLATELFNLFPQHRATLGREFLICHHPYLLVNPITAEPIGSRNKKTRRSRVRPSLGERPRILPHNMDRGCSTGLRFNAGFVASRSAVPAVPAAELSRRLRRWRRPS